MKAVFYAYQQMIRRITLFFSFLLLELQKGLSKFVTLLCEVSFNAFSNLSGVPRNLGKTSISVWASCRHCSVPELLFSSPSRSSTWSKLKFNLVIVKVPAAWKWMCLRKMYTVGTRNLGSRSDHCPNEAVILAIVLANYTSATQNPGGSFWFYLRALLWRTSIMFP